MFSRYINKVKTGERKPGRKGSELGTVLKKPRTKSFREGGVEVRR